MRWLRLIAGLLTFTVVEGGCILSKDKKTGSGPVFADLPTSIVASSPSAAGSEEEAEKMRPGDQIMMNFAQPGAPDLKFGGTILDDGTVTLLSNKVFTAAGKTPCEFEKEVYKSYGLNSYRIGVTDPDKP